MDCVGNNSIKGRKKIMVFYPSTLFPTIMMSQKRTLLQISSLVKNHQVIVATICQNYEQVELANEYFSRLNINFYVVKSVNWQDNYFSHNVKALYYFSIYAFTKKRVSFLKTSRKKVIKQIISIVNNTKVDVVISHYWHGSSFFKYLGNNICKIIDTHALVEEDLELNNKGHFYTNKPIWEKSYHIKSLHIQKKIFSSVDLIVLNSLKQLDLAKENYSKLLYYYCPNGQDTDFFQKYDRGKYDENTVLFYGTLNSNQNLKAFDLFYTNIWPKILQKNNKAKLIIVGNNPPDNIKNLSQFNNISVTGFVDDIRPYLCKACCMLLPMNIGVGFRGRVIEVMALGIPVIGNHNALDCVGFENGKEGFISDDYQILADKTLLLMENKELRNSLSNNCIDFVNKNYTLQNTYGNFSKFLLKI